MNRLDRLLPWLGYVADLGCTGLILGPIFASHSHGYDTVDHFRIDPRLGDNAAFDKLVGAAEEHGLGLVLDGVFNHVGHGFPMFVEALREGPESPAGRWFRWQQPTPPEGPTPECFEGHESLVVLDHTQPAVFDHVTRVMTHWLDRGARGWRLDAAYAVPPEFWRPVMERVRERHPEAWVFGEMIHGSYVDYVATSGLDSVTQYELWKAIWSSLNDGNFYELAHALDRHATFSEAYLPMTFVGNHDVTRLASRLDDPRHLGHALAVLFAVAGSPSVYYGDEQAFHGTKYECWGGDDEIRPALPPDPGGLAPYGWPAFRMHQRLIGLRRRHPWLSRCRTAMTHLTRQALALRCTPRDGGPQAVTVLLNLDDHPYRFPVDLLGTQVEVASDDAAAGTPDGATPTSTPAPDSALDVVGPHAWRVLSGDTPPNG